MNKKLTKSLMGLSFLAIMAWGLGILQPHLIASAIDEASFDSEAKVTICHYPPGDPGNMQTIEVGEDAVGTHLENGDTMGACSGIVPLPVNHGSWCSALLGAYQSTAHQNNAVINIDGLNGVDLTDIAMLTGWYANGNNDACFARFSPSSGTFNFDQSNFENIDWCNALKQGIVDTNGTSTGDPRFSSMFDLHPDGTINLSDVALVAQLIGADDQAACYAHFVPPMPAWPTPPVNHGAWCSALVGMMGSTAHHNNDVINIDGLNGIDLTDMAILTGWYTSGNNDACYARFAPTSETFNFDQSNYLNIDWCLGLKQGIIDTAGAHTGDANFSPIFDMNHDGVINLTDTVTMTQLVTADNQVACYAHYVPPMPVWPPADTVAPVITLLGDNPASVYQNDAYTDAGATALDNVDGDITSKIVMTGTVDTSTIGTYQLTYNVSDLAGNPATAVIRTVDVIAKPAPDTVAPVITLLGDNPASVYQNDAYTDAGATALDNVDGDITSKIVMTGTVDTSTIGTYQLTYNVSDLAGNPATAVIRTIDVIVKPTPRPNPPSGGGGGGGGFMPINIFNIKVDPGTDKATITWQTSRNSLTWMFYGLDTVLETEIKDNQYQATHTADISNLKPATTYHYQLRARDSGGNTVYDIERTFTTLATGGIVPQILGTKVYACVPKIDKDIVNVTHFANGKLIRACGPEVYLLIQGKKYHIISWQILHDNFFGRRIYNVSQEVVDSYPDFDGVVKGLKLNQ